MDGIEGMNDGQQSDDDEFEDVPLTYVRERPTAGESAPESAHPAIRDHPPVVRAPDLVRVIKDDVEEAAEGPLHQPRKSKMDRRTAELEEELRRVQAELDDLQQMQALRIRIAKRPTAAEVGDGEEGAKKKIVASLTQRAAAMVVPLATVVPPATVAPVQSSSERLRLTLSVERFRPQPINMANVVDWFLDWFRGQVRVHQMTPEQQFSALQMCLKPHEAESLQSGRLQ